MDLIDKSTLVAYLNDWRDKIFKGILSIPLDGCDKADATLEYEVLGKVISHLDALEVKEVKDVDYEKELNNYIEQHKSELPGYFDIRRIARHFFVFGLNYNRLQDHE